MNIRRAILFTLMLAFHNVSIAQGTEYKTGEHVRIAEADSIQRQVIAAGKSVEMSGWIGNDLFSAAEVISINGTVADDAIAAGQRITMEGTIGDLMMGAGETIVIDGEIEGDLFAAGREVRIVDNARIHGNAHIAAASIIFESGQIDGVLRAAAERMELNGVINIRARLYSQNVRFGPGYRVAGGTHITSSKRIDRENLGNIPDNLTIEVKTPPIWPLLLFKTGFHISLLVTGLVIIFLFRQTAADIHLFARERFWKNTGIGLLSFLLIPLAIIIFAAAVITIPLSLILIMLFVLALLFSYLLVAMTLGVIAIQSFRSETDAAAYYWGLILGMILIAILINLPFIGWFMNALLLFFGLGSLTSYFRARIKPNSPSQSG